MNAPHIPPPSATVDVDVLRGLIAVAQTRSVTAAAAQVGRTPAAVSMQIKKVEETLGRALFLRERPGMVVTADGERFLAYARRIVELHREALDAFREPELSGEVTVGTLDDFGADRLRDVFLSFTRCHPKATVNVVMASTRELAPAVESGALDLAVLTPGCATPWQDTDVLLHEEELVWVTCENGRAHLERPVPLAVATNGCSWRRATLASLEAAEIPYRIAFVSDSAEAHKAAVRAGLAITPLQKSRVPEGLRVLRGAEALPLDAKDRMALRFGPKPSALAESLAARIRESFGVAP